MVIGFWIVTALFCLQIASRLRATRFDKWRRRSPTWLSPPVPGGALVGQALGVMLLLAPVPARSRSGPYAGFAITLGSALIAISRWAMARSVGLGGGHRRAWALSYFFWRACRPRRRASTDPLASTAACPNVGPQLAAPLMQPLTLDVAPVVSALGARGTSSTQRLDGMSSVPAGLERVVDAVAGLVRFAARQEQRVALPS